MILDIDAGNSRLKWLLHCGDIGVPVARGAVPNDEVRSWLESDHLQQVDRVRLVSVAAATAEKVCHWGRSRQVELQVAKVVDGAEGVVCGYSEPERLGVDRWLALLAARRRCRSDCLVVDAGTAITVDVLSAGGQHAGGYIAPGLGLMAESLVGNTSGIRCVLPADLNLAPGVNTAQAVGHGCLAALVGMVAGIANSHRVAKLVLTGGDADLLAAHLAAWLREAEAELEIVDNLVLEGLDIALAQG